MVLQVFLLVNMMVLHVFLAVNLMPYETTTSTHGVQGKPHKKKTLQY